MVRLGTNNVFIEARDENGAVLQRLEHHNRMVAVGRNHFRDLLQGVGVAPNYIACGTMQQADIPDNSTEIGTEIKRVQCHSRSVVDNKAIFMATFDREFIYSHDYWDIKEFGLFAGCGWTSAGLPHDGGIMICMVGTAPIDVSDHLTTIFVVWEIPLFAE